MLSILIFLVNVDFLLLVLTTPHSTAYARVALKRYNHACFVNIKATSNQRFGLFPTCKTLHPLLKGRPRNLIFPGER